jgi:hypothetical protein
VCLDETIVNKGQGIKYKFFKKWGLNYNKI